MSDIIPFVRTESSDPMQRSVIYAVHGFWSGDTVRVRQFQYIRSGGYEPVRVDWSCGGRDMGMESNDLVAAECFSKALADAVQVAKEWESER